MTVLNPSKAHQRSAFAVEDPAYSIFQQKPPRRMEKSWLYPRAEYECFLLCQMRKAVERLTEENEILRRAGKTEKGA